jgi:hypothetical protein
MSIFELENEQLEEGGKNVHPRFFVYNIRIGSVGLIQRIFLS